MMTHEKWEELITTAPAQGMDVMKAAAAWLFDIPVEAVTDEQRLLAKGQCYFSAYTPSHDPLSFKKRMDEMVVGPMLSHKSDVLGYLKGRVINGHGRVMAMEQSSEEILARFHKTLSDLHKVTTERASSNEPQRSAQPSSTSMATGFGALYGAEVKIPREVMEKLDLRDIENRISANLKKKYHEFLDRMNQEMIYGYDRSNLGDSTSVVFLKSRKQVPDTTPGVFYIYSMTRFSDSTPAYSIPPMDYDYDDSQWGWKRESKRIGKPKGTTNKAQSSNLLDSLLKRL